MPSDASHFPLLKNLIGSIHDVDFAHLGQIAVFDLGLSSQQRNALQTMHKVQVYDVETKNPDVLRYFKTQNNGRMIRGWFAWKPIIMRQALDMFPEILYLDAGTTVLNSVDHLFEHIAQHGYFLMSVGPHNIESRLTKPVYENIVAPQSQMRKKIIMDKNTSMIDAGLQGLSRAMYKNYLLPVCECTKDLSLFADDGTAPMGFGAGRHDQTLFSIYAYLNQMEINQQGWSNLTIDNLPHPIHIHWDQNHINDQTMIFRSRWNYGFTGDKTVHIKYKKASKQSGISSQ